MRLSRDDGKTWPHAKELYGGPAAYSCLTVLPDGTIVARNSFMQPDQNKTDIRLQQRLPLGGRNSIDLIAEVFNAFNLENYSLVTNESAVNFNKPSTGQNRSAQLGFRLTF